MSTVAQIVIRDILENEFLELADYIDLRNKLDKKIEELSQEELYEEGK